MMQSLICTRCAAQLPFDGASFTAVAELINGEFRVRGIGRWDALVHLCLGTLVCAPTVKFAVMRSATSTHTSDSIQDAVKLAALSTQLQNISQGDSW